MRTFFVDRVYKPQVVMVCPKGEMFRFAQKPKQIEFSRPHLKTMVLDAQEREAPGLPAGLRSRSSSTGRPRCSCPQGWDYTLRLPELPLLRPVDRHGPRRGRRRRRRQAEEGSARRSTTRRSRCPSAWRWPRTATSRSSSTRRWPRPTARPAATTARATPRRSPPAPRRTRTSACPGKEETAKVVKDLLKGTGLPAASG